MSRKRQVVLLTVALLCAGGICLILIMNGLAIPCLFQRVTGLHCPGCGNTRAMMALFRLDFNSMFGYNLLFPLELLYLVRVYAVSAMRYVNGGRFSYYPKPKVWDILFLVLLIAWTVIRNCTPLY